MLNIKYCPQTYNDDLYFPLQEIFHENLEDKAFIKKYSDVPEFYLMQIDEYFLEVSDKKINKLVETVYEKFPWHFEVKRDYFFNQLNRGNDLVFANFFKHEISCLENNTDYGRVISDEEMRGMVYLIGKHFFDQNEEEKLIELYKLIETTQHPEFYVELATMILKKNEDNYATAFADRDENLWDWIFAESSTDLYSNTHYEPKNIDFYYLLNTDLGNLDIEKLDSLDHLENKEDIKNDILWLLKQGYLRIETAESVLQLDFLLYALYLIAIYEVKDLYHYITDLIFNMPDEVKNIAFGDFFNKIIGPAQVKIFARMNENDFNYLKPFEESKWYIKSIYLQSLASLYKHNDQSHYSYSLLKSLFVEFEKSNDDEMTGWLFDAISEINCEGFDLEINNAFDTDRISAMIHEDKQSWIDNNYFTDTIPIINTLSEMISHAQKALLSDDEISFEYRLEKMLEPYIITNYLPSEGEDDFGSAFTSYDNIRPLWGDRLPYKREEPKTGRNDACPCGSGKKYKKCCGK